MRISDWSSDVCSSDLPKHCSKISGSTSARPRSSSIFFSKKSADAWKLAKRSNCPVSAISNCAPKTSVPVEIPRPAKRSRSPHAVSSPSVLARSCASEWKPMRPAEQTITVLPDIPPKRYFAIGEVSELCEVKPHVLRYWEQEFPQLKQVKRRGNRQNGRAHV